jgi:cell division protein FtsQ
VRRTRLLLVRAWKPLVAAGALAAVLAAATVVLVSAPALAVDRILVNGRTRLPAGEIESRLGSLHGRNIFRVDLEESRARVLESSWVAQASMRRVLPSTIEVTVVERVPVALARLAQQLFLMDAEGVMLDELGPRYREFDLPVVDGLAAGVVAGGPRVDADRVRLAAGFLTALEVRPDLRDRISQINVANARDVIVLLEDDAALLHLGVERFSERLQFYLEMSPTLGNEFQDIEYVDLRFDGRLVVRSRTAETPALATASRRK